MFKHLKLLALPLIAMSFLTACAAQPPEVKKNEGVLTSNPVLKKRLVGIELHVIKLYSDKYTDSGVLSNDVATALKIYKGTDLAKFFSLYGKTAIETKISMIQAQNTPDEFILATSTGYVEDIKDGSIIGNFYNDGIKSKIASNIITEDNIAVKYSIDVERLIRLEKDKKNKLIDTPITTKKTFSQSMVLINNEYIVAGVINTLPKQFEIIIIKAAIQ